jgi:hypothetical protein
MKAAPALWLTGVGLLVGVTLVFAEPQKAEERKGITVEDLGRGLKSAAQNIEKEIPKLGSAIGSAVKKITEKEPEKHASPEPSKEKK